MRFSWLSVLVGLLMLSAVSGVSAADVCQLQAFDGHKFRVCTVDLAVHDIRIFLKKSDGSHYSHPEELPRDNLLFATNAGMFRPDYLPAGLYVENGRERAALNTRQGPGNFHVQPNGVFWVKSGVASVSTTQDYLKLSPEPDTATQSGPMLVIGGSVNAKFDTNGPSRYIRNGVGVADATHAYFAISLEPVSFGVFARLFRDQLKCSDALYLDGSVSRLFLPQMTEGRGVPLGPMIGVYTQPQE